MVRVTTKKHQSVCDLNNKIVVCTHGFLWVNRHVKARGQPFLRSHPSWSFETRCPTGLGFPKQAGVAGSKPQICLSLPAQCWDCMSMLVPLHHGSWESNLGLHSCVVSTAIRAVSISTNPQITLKLGEQLFAPISSAWNSGTDVSLYNHSTAVLSGKLKAIPHSISSTLHSGFSRYLTKPSMTSCCFVLLLSCPCPLHPRPDASVPVSL